MASLTQEGIHYLKSGDPQRARQLLAQAVDQDPRDVTAWLWLSCALDSREERLECLQRVLEIEPNHPQALSGLARINAGQKGRIPAGRSVPSQPISLRRHESSEPPPPPGSLPDFIPASRPISSRPSVLSPTEGERALFTVRPSLKPTLIIVLPLAVLLLVLVGAVFISTNPASSSVPWLVSLLYLAIAAPLTARVVRLANTSYTLTTRALIVNTGRARKTIPLSGIQGVACEQSFFERPFGIGDVVVESEDEPASLRLLDLADCARRTNQIMRLIQE